MSRSTYPKEAREPIRFVPDSLAHLDNPPTFFLRWGTPREKDRLQYLRDIEGVEYYSTEDARECLIEGVRELMGAEAAEWEPRIREMWSARDQWAAEQVELEPDERTPFNYPDAELVDEVVAQIRKDWRPYRIIEAESNRAARMEDILTCAIMLDRVENMDIAARDPRSGFTTEDVMEIRDALGILKLEKKLPDNASPWRELCLEAAKQLYLGKEREKNSASPSPSDSTPSDTSDGTASPNGKSPASGSSKRTRAKKSAKPNTP